MEKVNITSSNSKRTIEATLIQKTKEQLIVYVAQSGLKIHLNWERNEYVGKAAGMEFVSDGKIIED